MEVPARERKPIATGKEKAHRYLLDMLRIRRFEERAAELYTEQKIRGFLHLYIGEEAVAVGAMDALAPSDAVVGTYREHGHALARGLSPGAVMAEMYGKQEGCSRGRGGSMHLFDAERHFYGGNAIVGGHLPLAVGLALADKMQGRPAVTCCVFGEGAVAEGEFHESVNLAALWKLPVLFLCENNLYAMGTAIERSESEINLRKKAAAYKIRSESVDGMDVIAVNEAVREAAAYVRAGKGPCFLECRTYRFRAHSMFDAELYREKAEVEAWKKRGPIVTFIDRLKEQDLLTDAELAAMEKTVAAEVEEAVAFAEAGAWEPVEDLDRFVYSQSPAAGDVPTQSPAIEITYREAIREAIREAMRADERVFLMGEDVGRYGGCFAVSKGLLEEFGPERIRDTPLSESTFVGAGIGAALGGMRPIVEIMTVNFSLLAADQIVNNAATLLHMSGGLFNVPVVIRMATGGGKQLAAQHSRSLEGWYAHIPGLKVLTPATLEDARGMLLTALQDPDPVLIFENSTLYNHQGRLAADAGAVDISRARVRRQGDDVSIITYGIGLPKALAAAETLAGRGISAEVIDLRVLRPLDDATIMASVAKTHRALIVDEGWQSVGISAEISARITEQAFYDLDLPVQRLAGAEVPMPYAKHLEEAAVPQVDDIVETVEKMLRHE